MKTKLLKNWQSIECATGYEKFIKYYFLLNNFFQELFPKAATDTERMTEKFPQKIQQEWEEKYNKYIKEIYSYIHKYIINIITKHYFISTYSNDVCFIEIIKIEGNYLTKSDAELFQKFFKIKISDKISAKNSKEILSISLKIIYFVRNNFYHGLKSRSNEQNLFLKELNNVVLIILKLTTYILNIEPEIIRINLEKVNNKENGINSIIDVIKKKRFKTEDLELNGDIKEKKLKKIITYNKWNNNINLLEKIRYITCQLIDEYFFKYYYKEYNARRTYKLYGHLEISGFYASYLRIKQAKMNLYNHLYSLKIYKRKKNNKYPQKDNIKKLLTIVDRILEDEAINRLNQLPETNFSDYHKDGKIIYDYLQQNITLLADNSAINGVIEKKYKNFIKNKIKIYIEQNRNELQLSKNKSDFFQFAFNFIILEKINHIINRVLLTPKRYSIIDNIKYLKDELNIEFMDSQNNDINFYEDVYRKIKTQRNNIFHGNDNDNAISEKDIKKLNEDLRNFIKELCNWIKNKL